MNKKYNVFENIAYMFRRVNKYNKNSLLFFVFLSTLSKIIISLVQLFITPTVIKNFEVGFSMRHTLIIIFAFIAANFIFEAFVGLAERYKFARKIIVRSELIYDLVYRNLSMPYPMALDTELKQKFKKTQDLVNSNNSFAEMIFESIETIAVYFFMLIIYIYVLRILPVWLIIFTLISSLISFLISKKIKDWRFNNRELESKYYSKSHYLFEKSINLSAAKEIRIFGLNDWFNDIYRSIINAYKSFIGKASRKTLLAGILTALFDFLRNAITYYYLIDMFYRGQVDVAGFVLLFSAQGRLSAELGMLFEQMHTLVKYSNDTNVVREFLEEEDVFALDEGIKIDDLESKDINIELKHVFFKYSEGDDYILEDINLVLNPLDKVAIVGMNGSGKTTLVKLIIGFLEPTKGEVLLNGINLKEYNRLDYYRLFSAVFQEYSILPDSIKFNISQDMDNIDEERLDIAIKQSGLEEKINALPKGIESKLTKDVYLDGIELSGGETQKLLLARALYRQSQILILDEPTAALDPIAEKSLYNRYNELTEDMTSIFISHRMASTRFCDYILLIKDKQILEKGSYEELIKLNGEYKHLFDVQSKYYKEDVKEGIYEG